MGHGAAAHPRKDEQVEEVHDAEHDQHHADFAAEDLNGRLGIGRLIAVFEREGDEADIDEVKADHEQVIDRIGEALIAQETVHEEDAPVFVERFGDPDRKGHADSEIGEVHADGEVSGGGISENRVHRFSFLFDCYCYFCHYRNNIIQDAG
jgi:hypothetical protein